MCKSMILDNIILIRVEKYVFPNLGKNNIDSTKTIVLGKERFYEKIKIIGFFVSFRNGCWNVCL